MVTRQPNNTRRSTAPRTSESLTKSERRAPHGRDSGFTPTSYACLPADLSLLQLQELGLQKSMFGACWCPQFVSGVVLMLSRQARRLTLEVPPLVSQLHHHTHQPLTSSLLPLGCITASYR